jgi:hypothetical protein
VSRRIRDEARADLRQMRVLRAVIEAAKNRECEGAFRALETELLRAAGLDRPPSPREAVRNVARRLKRAKTK